MRPKRTHDVTPFDNLDRAAFVLAFLLGAGGSVLLKALGVHPFIPAAYAAIILGLYAFIAWAGGRVKIEPETIGDNCYYLGFLFTLAALAYTLFQVADPSANGGPRVDIPEVISGFGLALSSTIVGVFLRVFLMQLRPDFVAKDREVRAEVNRAFGDFKKGMTGMLSQMKSYAVESVQFASERDERIRNSTEKFLEDHQKALQESADALSVHMKEAFSDAAQEAAKQIMSAVGESQKVQQEQLKEVINDLQELRKRLQDQEFETVEEIRDRRKVFAFELEQTEKIFAAQMETVSEFRKNTLRMLSEIEACTAESGKFASEKDERRRNASEQFLKDNRKLLKENADFLSAHMTRQTKINEEPDERRQEPKAEPAEDGGGLNEVDAAEFDHSENSPHSGEEDMAVHGIAEPITEDSSYNLTALPSSDDEDKPDPYEQVPWTP